MKFPASVLLSAVLGLSVLAPACSVVREQQTAGAYVDDATITTKVKAKLVEDKTTAASSISVETLNSTVQLSGFAKSDAEKSRAEALAKGVQGVKSVRNDIIVRP